MLGKSREDQRRDPDRWRRDALGNTVFRKLVGCPGCLAMTVTIFFLTPRIFGSDVHGFSYYMFVCHHLFQLIDPRGIEPRYPKLILFRKVYCRVSGRDMNLLELSAYGNVRHGQDPGGCRIQ